MELWWVWVARVRCWEGELVLGNSIFNGETRFYSRVFLALQAWFQSGKPSPIYRKGVRIDKWENEKDLIRDWKWFEACLRMRFWGHDLACYDLVCTPNHLVLVLSIKQVQPRALKWPAMVLAFIQFGKFQNLHMARVFWFVTFLH